MNSFQLQYISLQLAFEHSNLPVSVLNLLQKTVCLGAVHLQVPAFMVQFLGQASDDVHQIFNEDCIRSLVWLHWIETVSHDGC